MKHECKITVLDTKCFEEYQKEYLADPRSGPCPFFKKGDTFILKRTPEQDDFYHLVNGKFCGEAWDAVSRYVYTAALPEAEERISWSMLTFWKGRNIIHFAATKKHIGLYPGDGATEAFKDELTGFDVSKGTIRLPYDQALPADLIARIARWCYEEYRK